MMKARITHNIMWKGMFIRAIVFNFLVPISITAISFIGYPRRAHNRLLEVGYRKRGDVGVIK